MSIQYYSSVMKMTLLRVKFNKILFGVISAIAEYYCMLIEARINSLACHLWVRHSASVSPPKCQYRLLVLIAMSIQYYSALMKMTLVKESNLIKFYLVSFPL